MKITITHIDTACVLLDINGFKILTDPTLDNAGKLYHHGFGAISRKTDAPHLEGISLNAIDLILLSHHQHKDNFDDLGKEFSKTVPKIISTKQAVKELDNSNVIGLDNWETTALKTDKVSNLKITATPAQHRPWWMPEFFSGKVIGFIIEFDEQKSGAIYISGDTVYFNGIKEIAKRYKIDVGIFHLGSAQFRYLSGFARYTMDGNDFLKATDVLKPNKIIPIHYKGWTHFKETELGLKAVIDSKDTTKHKTIFLVPGKSYVF